MPKRRQLSPAKLAKIVAQFNDQFPVGTKVMLCTDSAGEVETIVESEAVILGGHSAVARFKGVCGCYWIERRVRAVEQIHA